MGLKRINSSSSMLTLGDIADLRRQLKAGAYPVEKIPRLIRRVNREIDVAGERKRRKLQGLMVALLTPAERSFLNSVRQALANERKKAK